MTRVLYWNIENFGINKIDNPNTKKRKRGSSISEGEASDNRLFYINQVLTAVNPDVVVVVELEDSPFVAAGRLSQGAGRDGAIALRGEIQLALGGNWALVPPLQTGPTEDVAVFYERTNRYFAGPYVWPGGVGPAVAPGAATAAYPPTLQNGLPNRAVPAGALQNGGVNERRCAAQTAFTYAAAHMNAGAAIAWGVSRVPYMVSLYESAGAGRTLTIFGIHAPAAAGPAAQYLQDLADVAEIVDNIAANEVRLVIGDFNLQLVGAPPGLAEDPAYAFLQGQGYTLALRPVNPAPGAPFAGYPGYYATHIRSQYKAKCWPKGGVNPAYYPGYRYVGADHGPPSAAIDNAFFQYGAGIAAPGPHNFTIMNAVTGTPLNAVAPPSGGAWPGVVPLGRLTTVPPPAPPALPPAAGPAYGAALVQGFRGWANYGYIRSTSDHFALSIDV
jgi:hypothetical protein